MAKKKAAKAAGQAGKKRSPRKKTTTRKQGRPHKQDRPITPAILLEINRQWLEGVPQTLMAEQLGVHVKTIQYHVASKLRPAWERNVSKDKALVLAKINHMERTAWERFHSHAPAESREQIHEALLECGGDRQVVDRVLTRITREGQAGWLQIVQWCLEQTCKLLGLYAAERHEVRTSGELRVAGLDPDQLNQEMVAEWLERAEHVRAERRQATRGGG